ncbi:MAG: lipoate-protein ligase A [Planctomycetota bacterium]|jgi:lipoate-protein ligase A
MEVWRSITTWGAPASFNMGLDEALLLDPTAQPTLRFYSWKPDTLSLGYFQKYAEVQGTESAGAVVRRITGGGAIHHVNELTYSFVAPLSNALFRGKIGESYQRIHKAIAVALAEFGVAAKIRGKGVVLESERTDTGMCFHKSSCEDLVWNDRKGVGSAQRRKDGRVLHHGSIKLASSKLEGDIATLQESAGKVDPASLAKLVRECFTKQLGLQFEVGVPTPEEREIAQKLGVRYIDPAFVKRR